MPESLVNKVPTRTDLLRTAAFWTLAALHVAALLAFATVTAVATRMAGS